MDLSHEDGGAAADVGVSAGAGKRGSAGFYDRYGLGRIRMGGAAVQHQPEAGCP